MIACLPNVFNETTFYFLMALQFSNKYFEKLFSIKYIFVDAQNMF